MALLWGGYPIEKCHCNISFSVILGLFSNAEFELESLAISNDIKDEYFQQHEKCCL